MAGLLSPAIDENMAAIMCIAHEKRCELSPTGLLQPGKDSLSVLSGARGATKGLNRGARPKSLSLPIHSLNISSISVRPTAFQVPISAAPRFSNPGLLLFTLGHFHKHRFFAARITRPFTRAAW